MALKNYNPVTPSSAVVLSTVRDFKTTGTSRSRELNDGRDSSLAADNNTTANTRCVYDRGGNKQTYSQD